MSAFGTEVKRLLAAQGKDASWLHTQTKISHSTISNWLNNPADVQPKPSSVAKVAKALGISIDVLAAAAGYSIQFSTDDGERSARRAAILAARPRLAQRIDEFERLDAHQEDVLISMMEAYLDATLHRPDPQAVK